MLSVGAIFSLTLAFLVDIGSISDINIVSEQPDIYLPHLPCEQCGGSYCLSHHLFNPLFDLPSPPLFLLPPSG